MLDVRDKQRYSQRQGDFLMDQLSLRDTDMYRSINKLLENDTESLNALTTLTEGITNLSDIGAFPPELKDMIDRAQGAVSQASDMLPPGLGPFSGLPNEIIREIYSQLPGSGEEKGAQINGLLGVIDNPANGGNGDGIIEGDEIKSAFDNDSVLNQLGQLNATMGKMFRDPTFRSRTIAKIDAPSIYDDSRAKYNNVSMVQQGFALNEQDMNMFNVNF
jgi:hypothetical protein